MRLTVTRLLRHTPIPHNQLRLCSQKLSARSFRSTPLLRRDSQYRQIHREIPVRGNGNITIDIISSSNQPISSSQQRVLLYFPPGPFYDVAGDGSDTSHQASKEGDASVSATSIPAHLASLLSPLATIVTVCYRISASPLHRQKYPLPIHDVLFALDWIFRDSQSLVAEGTSVSEDAGANIEKPVPIISVYGTHIGASLATMLSLTEYSQIHSTAISSPILNWVDLDEKLQDWGKAKNSDSEPNTRPSTKNTKKRPKSKAGSLQDHSSVQRLLKLRDRLFTRPSAYFDPFASPMLMLRNPGRDCPVDNMFDDVETEEDVDRIMLSDLEENYNYSDPGSVRDSGYESFGPYDDDMHTVNDAMIQRRKTLSKWPIVRPPRSEKTKSVQPPLFRVILRDGEKGEGRILQEQGEEIVELIGKCCYSKSQEQDFKKRTGVEKITVSEGEDAEKKEAKRAALWFQEVWKKTEATETGKSAE